MARIIVGCEFSGVVREAFRAKGHSAWSCDLLPADDNSPFHIQDDILNVLRHDGHSFELGIFHPPCTYLTVSGNKWMKPEYADRFPTRQADRQTGMEFFMALVNAPIPRICIENPIGIMSTKYREPDQVVQPWMFGHGETKATCFWLKNLPRLVPTHIDDDLFAPPTPAEREQRLHKLPPSADRWKLRSMTYPGIAKAMSEQWGNLC